MSERSNRDKIAFRREIIGRLRLRGMSTREIARELERSQEYKDAGGEPVTQSTVVKDLQAVRRDWERSAMQSASLHQQRQLAEIREARRAAWKNGDLAMVEKLLAREMDLLGTKAPQRYQDVSHLTDEELIRQVQAVIAGVSGSEPGGDGG